MKDKPVNLHLIKLHCGVYIVSCSLGHYRHLVSCTCSGLLSTFYGKFMFSDLKCIKWVENSFGNCDTADTTNYEKYFDPLSLKNTS